MSRTRKKTVLGPPSPPPLTRGSERRWPGLTQSLHDGQHVLAALHFDSRHRQVSGLVFGQLQLLHDGLEDSGAESLLHVFKRVLRALGYHDHEAQVVRELQLSHLEYEMHLISAPFPSRLRGPGLSFSVCCFTQ